MKTYPMTSNVPRPFMYAMIFFMGLIWFLPLFGQTFDSSNLSYIVEYKEKVMPIDTVKIIGDDNEVNAIVSWIPSTAFSNKADSTISWDGSGGWIQWGERIVGNDTTLIAILNPGTFSFRVWAYYKNKRSPAPSPEYAVRFRYMDDDMAPEPVSVKVKMIFN